MNIVLVSSPVAEPITISDLELHSVYDAEVLGEDPLLNDQIQSARELVEDMTRRALLTQTWDYYINNFPSANRFKIPLGNLQSVTHIKYTDSNGTQTTMTVNTEYIVETNGDKCGAIVLPYGTTWPSFTKYSSNPIVIRFVAGWTTAENIPAKIRTVCKMIALDLYENRESQAVQSSVASYKENPVITRMLASAVLWDEFV